RIEAVNTAFTILGGVRAPRAPARRPRRRRAEAASMSTEPIGTRTYPLTITDEQWRERLSPADYPVLRQGGTERPGSGKYEEVRPAGTYACKACGAELFTAETQFDARCGWPSFYAPTDSDSVELLEDTSLGMRRVEVRCASCGSHLGH